MSGTDWIIIAVLVLSVIQAASAGFFQEIFGIAGMLIGYLLAAWQYENLAQQFRPYLQSSLWLGEIAAFLVIFFAVMILAGISGRIARWLIKGAGLSFADRLLGAGLGLVRGGLSVAIILMGMAAFTPTSSWLEGSKLAPYFLVAGRAAIWLAPADMRTRFYSGLDVLRLE
ncbi:MAG: CvpA family protein [Acidobacteriales bacterium]|nr:CvpA family protein [Terriglobales bacterium]